MSNDSIKLARMEENMKALSRSFVEHETEDSQRFDRMFGYMKERFDKADVKLDSLWDKNNRQEGAFGFGKWVAGGVGGLIVFIGDLLSRGNH